MNAWPFRLAPIPLPLGPLFDLLYPPRCLARGCGRQGDWLCAACKAGIPWLSELRCPRCCLPGPGPGPCPSCRSSPPGFDRAHAATHYAAPIDVLIRTLKYRPAASVAPCLAEIVARQIPLDPRGYDAVLALPSHPARVRERGIDHAACLAGALATCLGRPHLRGLLQRARPTQTQVGLDARQRRANVAGAFVAPAGLLGAGPLDLLLVDDVMTTGATASAAARALREAGAGRVTMAVVARALPPGRALSTPRTN